MNRAHIYFFFFCLVLFLKLNAYNALVINPVADLIGEPIATIHLYNNFIRTYHDIPLCGKSGDYACPRLSQLLKNEKVTILEQRGSEVLIQAPHLFYESSSTKQMNYWSEKKNFITFDQLQQQHIDLSLFPPAIQEQNNVTSDLNIVSLKLPYKNPHNTLVYSAGTQFVCKQKTNDSFIVHIYNPEKQIMELVSIPHHSCFYNQHRKSPEQKQKDFIALLKSWVQKPGFIPYVWGGSSLTTWYKHDTFTTIDKQVKGTSISYYNRPELTAYPCSGFDCSGLISRAAQLCGIPFYFKNSITIANNLKTITHVDEIHEGDIIWIPGHVMVISSLKNNKLIEARHYFDDYGKIHEIDLQSVFKNISTYAQLFETMKSEPLILERLSKKGTVTKEFNHLKILKLASVWHTKNH